MGPRAHSGLQQVFRPHTPTYPSTTQPPNPLLFFAPHLYLLLSPLGRYTHNCMLAETLGQMPRPVSAFERGAWSSAGILHWGYAHVPSSLLMQSRHRESPGQGFLQGRYRSDHHLHLICPLRFVSPEPLIAHDSIRPTYCPIAFFFPYDRTSYLRACPFRLPRVDSRKV